MALGFKTIEGAHQYRPNRTTKSNPTHHDGHQCPEAFSEMVSVQMSVVPLQRWSPNRMAHRRQQSTLTTKTMAWGANDQTPYVDYP